MKCSTIVLAWLLCGVPIAARADPLLTPLLSAALANTALGGTAFTIGVSAVSYASIATYGLKAPK